MDKKNLTVLALDDNNDDLLILKEYLNQIDTWNVTFIGFESWDSGMAEITARQLDVIFLDFRLGKLTGLDILKKIRNGGDQRPVIVLTGQGDESIAAELGRAGADEYLVKGELNPQILRIAVNKAINEFQSRKENLLLSQQLQQSQKMETIGELTGGIAHDFNNMLTGVMGYLELALIKSKGRDIEKELTKAQQACKSMAKFVNQLVNFSRKSLSERAEINLNRLIEDTRSVIKHTLPKHIRIDTDLPGTPLSIYADVSAIQQVILNLCINAGDAMPDGGTIRLIAREITVDQELASKHAEMHAGNYILIEVHDTGKGIDSVHQHRIFEPFFSTKQRDHNRGTGLGLTIVWRNVIANGGTVTVKSGIDVGTIFSVYLPAHSTTRSNSEYKPDQAVVCHGSETILLVDDEKIVRTVASELLTHLGYKVHTASSGLEALEVFQAFQRKIDMVILDLSMPEMNGRECITHLLKIAPATPVLFASGHSMLEEENSLLKLGAIGVVQKPYQLIDMATKIRNVLGPNKG
jgi:signal transduction histidine kinase